MGSLSRPFKTGWTQGKGGAINNTGAGGASVIYNIFGVKELDDLFNQLKFTTRKAVMIAAFRKASKPLVTQSKSNLLARAKGATASGNLYRSIGVIPHRRLPILKIGARSSGNWSGYHGHLIDAGTKERSYTTKSGKEKSTGAVQPTSFFKSAIQQQQEQVINIVRDEMIRELVMRTVKAQSKGKSIW